MYSTMSPFSGNYIDSKGIIQNLDGTTIGPARPGLVETMHPFLGVFYDSTGALHELKDISGFKGTAASIITTLTASGWVDGEQRITNEAITATSTGLILLAPTITTAQFNAFNNAALLVVGQGAGWLDVQVFNVQPTVNIPIILMLWG